MSIDDVLAVARAGLRRLTPAEAAEATRNGARLVDIRTQLQRQTDGELPGAIVIERNDLERCLDPTSGERLPEATEKDIPWIVICDQGDSSSLAAASLRAIGLRNATDVIGGFQAWKQARPIYLDHNATTPVDPRVLQAALPYLTQHFGNPSSSHAYAAEPHRALERSRTQVADLIGARPEEIVFTAGGSEADTLAICGLRGRRGGTIVTQPTEHPAVLQACRSLEDQGITTTYLPVDEYGRVSPDDLEAALDERTLLVSIMHANSETGTIQPIRELAAIARRHGVVFHTDAAQTAGKIPIDVDELGVDLLTVVGHKMYAPKGIGALYVRAGTQLRPIIHGGGQEGGLRSGTENVALAVALGTAAELARPGDDLVRLRDLLQHELERLLPGRVHLNGHPTDRLPGTLNVSIDGIRGRDLLAAVPEIAASTGSACHEGADTPSAVLSAMGVPPERALGALRLTLGRSTTEHEIRRAAKLLAERLTSSSRAAVTTPQEAR
ncbi:aminotransferase class V-fold PLP-dependent enzyme [Nonomuraea sp. NPDC050556]|uniref:aminotransferase class V-fold PLP-dependent enzyme n=1 Tax=Nonomuraea sp. NPDC050556 TaxID=3364369 RepID=UPI0037B6F7C3